MILTVHLATGALIAAKTSNPFLGIALAFASHFILDAFPHKEYSISSIKNGDWDRASWDFLKIFWDVFFGFLIVLLSAKNLPLAAAGAFAASLPDGLSFLHYAFPKLKFLGFLLNLHRKTHWFEKNKNFGSRLRWLELGIQPLIIIITIFLFRQQW